MPRKITGITFNNYRSWYGPYPKIELPNGENLLIYGENGSGKSSFFKGVQNFFRSALNGNLAFELNKFSVLNGNISGSIKIEFSDLPPDVININEYEYTLGGTSNNNQAFIVDTSKLNAFLDYKHLLSVHFTDPESTSIPNLFYLLIETLLSDYTLPATGNTIKEEITSIEAGLKRKSDSSFYINAENSIPIVRESLGILLNEIINEANRLLNSFDANIEIQLNDFGLEIDGDNHKLLDRWLQLQIRYAEQVINDYNYFLNEARLSAISICFYLAAILSHPPGATLYKILYLDDVFIGLDTSNRLPLLSLLKTEFSPYQIFINTYDRNWYEVAKNWFLSQMNEQWKFQEMYVYKNEFVDRPSFDSTISIRGESNFSQALFYLHNKSKPDYPASANYLRKYAEELLKGFIPEVELKKRDENIGEFPDFILLKELINTAKNFLQRINNSYILLDELKANSKRLLNPLSHYNPITPIFKSELDEVADILRRLDDYLQYVKANLFKLSINPFSLLRVKYNFGISDDGYYELRNSNQLYKYRNSIGGTIFLSDSSCKSTITYRITASTKSPESKRVANYNSLSDAYNSIYVYLVSEGHSLVQEANWINAFEFMDDNGNWNALASLII